MILKQDSSLKQRIKFLKMANKHINPVEVKSHSEINDLLAVMRDEGLIKFSPDNIVSRSQKISLTDLGLKRLDEMKRSKYPEIFKWSSLTGVVAIVIYIISGGA